jgi:hypothetical protein
MTTTNDTVDQIYVRLIHAPDGVDCRVTDVVVACARFVGAILKNGYANQAERQNVVDWFCRGLQSYVNRSPASATKH